MFRFLLLCLSIQTSGLFAQPAIFLENPSFEDLPAMAHPPQGWYFCGQSGESPPDIHPGGFFGVEQLPQDGVTFVGMVVRDNGTHESIGQRLSSPLQAGHCYSFSLFAARSETYQSISRSTGAPANFRQPAALYIWGGKENCDRQELLAKSPPILYEGWKQYSFSIQPQETCTHLSIEAYFAIPGPPYNGNVLIDHASPLIEVDCEQGKEPLPEVEVVAMPDIQDTEALHAFLTEQGQQIRFSEDGILLEQHLFAGETGRQYQANKYLWKIGRALSRFPAYRILVAVGGSSDYLQQSHLRQFEQALRAAGLEDNQYRLRARKRSDRKRQWLWRLEEREFVMRLEGG